MSDVSDAQFDRLVAAWLELRHAFEDAGITARLTFFKHYPIAKKFFSAGSPRQVGGKP